MTNTDHPRISGAPYPERVSRAAILLVIVRSIILIPQYVVLAIWGFLAGICLIIMWVAAIFTASYPRGMYNFVLAFYQKMMQVYLYSNMLSEKYPPITLGGEEVADD